MIKLKRYKQVMVHKEMKNDNYTEKSKTNKRTFL